MPEVLAPVAFIIDYMSIYIYVFFFLRVNVKVMLGKGFRQ